MTKDVQEMQQSKVFSNLTDFPLAFCNRAIVWQHQRTCVCPSQTTANL